MTGCRPSHLIYVYDMSLGVDVAYSNEGSGKLIFGYDRGTYAIVPQKPEKKPEKKDSKENGELMSLAGVSHVKVDGLNEIKFDHFIAAGEAATLVAEDPTGLGQVREAIYGKEPK